MSSIRKRATTESLLAGSKLVDTIDKFLMDPPEPLKDSAMYDEEALRLRLFWIDSIFENPNARLPPSRELEYKACETACSELLDEARLNDIFEVCGDEAFEEFYNVNMKIVMDFDKNLHENKQFRPARTPWHQRLQREVLSMQRWVLSYRYQVEILGWRAFDSEYWEKMREKLLGEEASYNEYMSGTYEKCPSRQGKQLERQCLSTLNVTDTCFRIGIPPPSFLDIVKTYSANSKPANIQELLPNLKAEEIARSLHSDYLITSNIYPLQYRQQGQALQAAIKAKIHLWFRSFHEDKSLWKEDYNYKLWTPTAAFVACAWPELDEREGWTLSARGISKRPVDYNGVTWDIPKDLKKRFSQLTRQQKHEKLIKKAKSRKQLYNPLGSSLVVFNRFQRADWLFVEHCRKSTQLLEESRSWYISRTQVDLRVIRHLPPKGSASSMSKGVAGYKLDIG
jgi:hypothetical protein